MITKRDLKVLQFIEEFKVANTSTLYQLFYPSLQVAQRRLRKMVEINMIKRDRYTFTQEYIYYTQKTKQLNSDLLLTNLYREISKQAKIIKFTKEFTNINGIRPDAFVVYQTDKIYMAFVEIEISNKGFDLEKYIKTFKSEAYKPLLPTMPYIFAICDNSIKNSNELKLFQFSTDLSNLKL